MNFELLLIDPQNDFCRKTGSLYVDNAEETTPRIKEFITKYKKKIQKIRVSRDSHPYYHICHPIYWVDSKGNMVQPFTMIDLNALNSGKYRPLNTNQNAWAKEYLTQLQNNNRYAHTVWPFHCMIGDKGYVTTDDVNEALLEWQSDGRHYVEYVPKGSNFQTEHYSAIMADVPTNDPTTQVNTPLLQALASRDKIGIGGFALNFCVANTVTDIANNFGEENIKKLVILEDLCAEIGAFHDLTKKFMDNLVPRGMEVMTSSDFANKYL